MKNITYCNDSLCIKKTCDRHPIYTNGLVYISRSDYKDCELRDHGKLNLKEGKK